MPLAALSAAALGSCAPNPTGGPGAALDADTEPEGIGCEHIANETIHGITSSESRKHLRVAAQGTGIKNQRSRIGNPR